MSAPDRAYDPKRRPNTFYKGDKASNAELATRAIQRGQSMSRDKAKSLSDDVSDTIGYEMSQGKDFLSPEVGSEGKTLNNISAEDGQGTRINRASSSNMPISGTRLGKIKGTMDGKRQA